MVEQTKRLAFAAFGIAVLLLVSVFAVYAATTLGGMPGFGGGDQTPTPSPDNDTPTPALGRDVTLGDTTVTLGDVDSLPIRLGRPADGYGAATITVSLNETAVADIRGVEAGGSNRLTVLSESSDSVTFRVHGIGSNRDTLTVATVVVHGTAPGTTAVEGRVRAFTDAEGDSVVPRVTAGRVTVYTFPPSVRITNQTFHYVNQPRIGQEVVVDEAFLPRDGFVVLYARHPDGSIGVELGHSAYLRRGNQSDISITPDRLIHTDQPVIVRLHADVNDNQAWDGPLTDPRLATANRSVVTDAAWINVAFTTTVDVVLTNASDGLQRYAIALRTPAQIRTFVTTVTPHYITGSGFGIVRGGEGVNLVAVRGVDLEDELSGFLRSKTLLTVTFQDGDQLDRDEVILSVDTLLNDNGTSIPHRNLTVRIRCFSPFNGTAPGRPRFGPPTDPDCDGLYEDIDGDGLLTDGDVRALAFIEDHQLTDEQIEALDFNGNGTIDFGDVELLRKEVRRKSS